ncbi:hypothetical protein [Oceanobacillus timonensis]|uniref:hypothetical protein n=1 Tax=Oceanobacillus timonensis TaxID=1926285 RepID=UPI0009B9315E|nr:hypothetical protein [Oceanobacillus timonensis]
MKLRKDAKNDRKIKFKLKEQSATGLLQTVLFNMRGNYEANNEPTFQISFSFSWKKKNNSYTGRHGARLLR